MTTLTLSDMMPPLGERIKLFKKWFDAHYEMGLGYDIHGIGFHIEETLNMCRYINIEKFIEESLKQEDARWVYDDKIGLFINKPEEAQIALCLPRRGYDDDDNLSRKVPGHTKYIIADKEDGQRIVAALPYDTHGEIRGTIQKATEQELSDVRGGHLSIKMKGSKPIVTVYGQSIAFGRADHEETACILKHNGIEAIIEEER